MSRRVEHRWNGNNVKKTMTDAPATLKTVLGFLLISAVAAPLAPAQQSPRIPRQTDQIATAVQGIIRNPAGLGLGGATVQFQAGAQQYRAITTGDGVFRILNVLPGTYELTIERDAFQSFRRSGIQIRTGDTLNFEVALPEIPPATPGVREVPLRPELGKRQAPFEMEPVQPQNREIPVASNAQIVAEMAPLTQPPPYDRIFTAVRNRWSDDYPPYSRYGQKGEFPYVIGHLFDPFNRNKLKGDYPIFGKRTFLNVKLFSETFADLRRIPTPSNVGSENPDSQNFFGGFKQFAMSETLAFSFDLFRGDAAFRPIDWRIKFTPEVNVNYIKVDERGIVNIDVRKGTTRTDAHLGLQEAFVEVKLKDLGHEYDFISARAGIQGFNSDFRGFIFSDQEPGLRVFGNFRSNRYQYNLAYFSMLEKDTNSGLNRLEYRNQQVWIANLYRQDFIKRGYTIQFSFHYNKDDQSFRFDENNFLVRPSPIGIVKPHY
ncbi:MAG: carboxypeptidase-like regulatory domain-containing protein, partial [Bryobacteraceae bacterium]